MKQTKKQKLSKLIAKVLSENELWRYACHMKTQHFSNPLAICSPRIAHALSFSSSKFDSTRYVQHADLMN